MPTKRPVIANSDHRKALTQARPLAPDRVAFLGEYSHRRDGAEPSSDDLLVLALCWPTSSTAWDSLIRSWAALRAVRDNVAVAQESWVLQAAPQLAAHLDEPTTQESTLAALIARTQIRCSVTVVHGKRAAETTLVHPAYQSTLTSCITTYNDFLKTPPSRQACNAIVARSRDQKADRIVGEAVERARKQVADAEWLDHVRVFFWNEPTAPLPLEVATLTSGAVARRVLQPLIANPIWDAITPKLVRFPPGLAPLKRRKRR